MSGSVNFRSGEAFKRLHRQGDICSDTWLKWESGSGIVKIICRGPEAVVYLARSHFRKRKETSTDKANERRGGCEVMWEREKEGRRAGCMGPWGYGKGLAFYFEYDRKIWAEEGSGLTNSCSALPSLRLSSEIVPWETGPLENGKCGSIPAI